MHIGLAYQMNVYVSTAGRPFVRVAQSGTGGVSREFKASLFGSYRTMSYETAPGQAAAGDHVNFEGRSIVVYREFESGARRVAVDLDVAKTVCKATVINGRRSGKTLVPNTAAGERIEVSSVQIGAVNCSIRDGNVFGQ